MTFTLSSSSNDHLNPSLTWRCALILQVIAFASEHLTKCLRLRSTILTTESTDLRRVIVVGRSAAERGLDQALLGAVFLVRHARYAQVLESVQKGVHHTLECPQPFETADALILLSAHALVADLLEVVGGVRQLQFVAKLVVGREGLRAGVRVRGADELGVVQAERGADRLILALVDAVTCERLVVLLEQRAAWLDLGIEIVHARLLERLDAAETRLICMTNVRAEQRQGDQWHQNEPIGSEV